MITNHQPLHPQSGPKKQRAFIVSISMLLMAAVVFGWLMTECVQSPLAAGQTDPVGVAEAGEGFLACLTVAFALNIVNEPRQKN